MLNPGNDIAVNGKVKDLPEEGKKKLRTFLFESKSKLHWRNGCKINLHGNCCILSVLIHSFKTCRFPYGGPIAATVT